MSHCLPTTLVAYLEVHKLHLNCYIHLVIIHPIVISYMRRILTDEVEGI